MAVRHKYFRVSKLFKSINNHGFTVVELAVVIAVISVLVLIAVPQYNGILQRSNDTERKTDLTSLSAQLEYYYGRYGGYPTLASLNNSTFRQNNKISSGDNSSLLADPRNRNVTTLSSTATPNNAYSYIPEPSGCVSPTDNNGNTVSTASTICNRYRLIARLEDPTDPDKDSSITGSIAYYIKRNASNN